MRKEQQEAIVNVASTLEEISITFAALASRFDEQNPKADLPSATLHKLFTDLEREFYYMHKQLDGEFTKPDTVTEDK